MTTPDVAGMAPVIDVLRSWQDDAIPLQLHPGDVGWYWRHGPEATARALRVWWDGDRIVGIAQLDGPDLLRVTIAPDLHADAALARVIEDDISDPDRGVLSAGGGSVEVPIGTALRDLMSGGGWTPGQQWVPLQRSLAEPVEDPGVVVEVAGPAAVASGAPAGSGLRAAGRWRMLAASIPYPDARCLIAHDESGEEVAVITVWSAGPGRPGLVVPLGVESSQRGKGYGRSIVLAGCAALRELGSSSILALVEATNVGAGRTYLSAGFRPYEAVPDLDRL